MNASLTLDGTFEVPPETVDESDREVDAGSNEVVVPFTPLSWCTAKLGRAKDLPTPSRSSASIASIIVGGGGGSGKWA